MHHNPIDLSRHVQRWRSAPGFLPAHMSGQAPRSANQILPMLPATEPASRFARITNWLLLIVALYVAGVVLKGVLERGL